MASFRVEILGIEEARAYFSRLKGGAEAAGRLVILVGSPLPYAYGIEFGRHRRSRRLARAAGPAHYLTNALRSVEPRIKPEIAAAIQKGPEEVFKVGLRLGHEIEAKAKEIVPIGKVRGGSLRRSLHTVPGSRT